ncbi:MAG: ParM/StbA family protein [Firmicutes bacterium]|jgi:plasmid segregation protein ParM|nr:ParM/StbA family protein [Bacillota bacterium]
MTKLVGLDVGYGFVKATDGESGYSFPSVVGEGHTKPTFSIRSNHMPVIDNLKIEMGQKLYYVGKAAVRQSKFVYRDLSYTRATGDDFEILFYSALSLFCPNRTNEFKVVTGLPVERIHLAKDLEKRVRGERNIKIFRGGEIRDTRVYVSEVEIVPQPLGTYWSQFLNLDGGEEVPMEGLTGIIDIGFRTTDLAAIEDGEYIPEKSKSLSVGLATAYSDVGSKLATEYGLEKESYALDGIIIKRKINISGQALDITDIVVSAFEKLAINILVEINSQWRISDFDNLILTGGGGQAISSYLLSQLPQAKLAVDPITANCRGYLAWGNWLWQLAGIHEETGVNSEQEFAR